MRVAREYETPLLLGLICALLALAVSSEWLWKTLASRALRAEIARIGGGVAIPAENTEPKAFDLPPLEHFDDIVERPIFIQGRRPVVVDEAAPIVPEKPFDLQLHGIVIGPDGVLALLKDKAGHHYKLRENEKLKELNGWVMAQIGKDRDRILMTRGEAQQELLLQKPKPAVKIKAPVVKASDEEGVIEDSEEGEEGEEGEEDEGSGKDKKAFFSTERRGVG